MKELRRLAIVVPAVALVVLLVLLFLGRGTVEQLAFLRRNQGVEAGLVDQRPFQTAQTLTGMAVSAEEQNLAQQAERLADHEVDQAFAQALREASMRQQTLTGEAEVLAQKVAGLQATVKQDQAQVDSLSAAAKASGAQSSAGDDLDVAKAQLQLDQDELADAAADLARASGDHRGRIQQELETREAAAKANESSGAKKATAVTAVRQHGTLWARGKAWFEQRSRVRSLAQAEQQARADSEQFAVDHDRLERGAVTAGQPLNGESGTARVRRLQRMATRRSIMGILDDRSQTELQLANVYQRWQQQVWVQHKILGYLVLQSLALVALLVLVTMVGGVVGRKLVDRVATEPRQAQTLRTILTLGLEIFGLAGVLLVIFGVPQQLTTVLGLVTAGLTVVFQDFILAFFGWFVLMGRDGIRVGDWVEIDEVRGEVSEIGLFRTLLLETENWTSTGHPTGRKVTMINSYAIRGKYFNFSTHGQWMWDEIQLNVPANANAYELIVKMQEAVERETAADSAEAEREWQKATTDVGLSQFTARPTVDLRPAASGVDVIVRFVTRASERFGLRNRIYEALVGLMEGTERPALESPKESPKE
jgi:small-conductance mechanosensitive channel